MKRNELIGLIRESIGNVLLKEDMELSWAKDRRDRDDWNEKNLHSGDLGSQAHALFKHLRNEGDIDESYDVYDITELPSQYIGNVSTPNPHPTGLIEGRPWAP